MSTSEESERRILDLLGSISREDLVALVASPIYGEALHFVDGKLCACSHGLKCGPLDDEPNAVIPDVE